MPHLHLMEVETADFAGMLDSIRAFSLPPRDALHIAVMRRLGLTAIASDDADFDRVDKLERHWVFKAPVSLAGDAGSKVPQ